MEENTNIEIDTAKILMKIYTNIFCSFEEQYIIVFLCVGASTKEKKSLRDKIRIMLENEKKRYSWLLPIKVFYPEDLLIEVLNKTKDADLLSYEQFLANNSHVIAIICESAGSLVELGAFTNNEYTVNKVIAAVEKKRIKDKSFIMLGPIKYLKRKSKVNVVEYGVDEDKFARDLLKNIREKHMKAISSRKISLCTIVGMHYFIQLLLYCFKFNILFNAALKLLFQDKQIIKMTDQRYGIYKLTKKGYSSMEKMITRCTSGRVCDKIRIEIMYCNYYKSPHS